MMTISYYPSCHFFDAELYAYSVEDFTNANFLHYNNMFSWCGLSLFKENCYHFEESQLGPGKIGGKIF